uniref:NADH-ubiquinone oxidoreductase chain 4 n=1 Tax=Urodontus sp. URO01 TaxID=1205589 RepID=A0A0S2MPB3_9CUCU|nr:NADH deshydrogenase subunit 4 [Urodontus sp. URO01]
MMKFIMCILFMSPLCFLFNFWIIQFFLFILTFIYIFSFSIMNYFENISYVFGGDLFSYFLIILSFWICSLMIMASEKIYKFNNYFKFFNFVVVMLLFSLLIVFSSMNLFIFYLFFEISLIPTLILIIGWGYQPERVEAGIYMLFYTLFFSLPMMISLFYFYEEFLVLDYFFFEVSINNLILFFCLTMVFFVKLPLFMVHLWLPKAHVEAPISGSMILAGVMLKLGGYGLYRVVKLFFNLGMKLNFYFIVFSLSGGGYCLIYLFTSKSHKIFNCLFFCLSYENSNFWDFNFNDWGLIGSLILMVAHGLCSSGLFCLANMNYERINSRSLYLNKGMMNLSPSLAFWWFMLSISNMAAPPSFNLLGEVILINCLVSWSWLLMLFLMLISFFSAAYSLMLYSFSQHGKISSSLFSFNSFNVREFLLLILHWVPLNLLFLKLDLFV